MQVKKVVRRAGAIIIKDGKVLLERSKGKSFFIPPGGQVEEDETFEQCLVRELKEELRIDVSESDLERFDTYYKPAGGQEDYDVQMDVFLVKVWKGEIARDSEVEELLWIGSVVPDNITIGSIFLNEVLPKLKSRNLIWN